MNHCVLIFMWTTWHGEPRLYDTGTTKLKNNSEQQLLNVYVQDVNTKNIYEPTGSVIQSLAVNLGLLNTWFGNLVLFPISHCLFASYRSWDWQKNETSDVS